MSNARPLIAEQRFDLLPNVGANEMKSELQRLGKAKCFFPQDYLSISPMNIQMLTSIWTRILKDHGMLVISTVVYICNGGFPSYFEDSEGEWTFWFNFLGSRQEAKKFSYKYTLHTSC
jgi:hypothetical protein